METLNYTSFPLDYLPENIGQRVLSHEHFIPFGDLILLSEDSQALTEIGFISV